MDRTTLNIGPGIITWDGASIHVEDNITLDIAPTMFDVLTAGHGKVDARREDLQITVRGTPKMWTDLAKLFPYAQHEVGQSLYGDTDKPLVIRPRSGVDTGFTLANARITKMPTITLASNKPILGEIEFTGLLANNGDPADIADYISTSDGGALTGFDLSKIPNGLYQASWGTVLQDFLSEEGFQISFEQQISDVKVDGLGTIDKTLEGLMASCSVIPVGITAQQILDVHGATTAIGAAPPKHSLVITGQRTGLPIVTLANCLAETSQARTGRAVKRAGEFRFSTLRTANTGVIGALWTFGTAA